MESGSKKPRVSSPPSLLSTFFLSFHFLFSLHNQHRTDAVVAAVVGHAPQEKLLQLRLGVRRHHQRGCFQIRSFAADDGSDGVGVDFCLHEMDHRVGPHRQQAREEALGDEVLGVLDELLVGGGVLLVAVGGWEEGRWEGGSEGKGK